MGKCKDCRWWTPDLRKRNWGDCDGEAADYYFTGYKRADQDCSEFKPKPPARPHICNGSVVAL